MKKYPMVKIKNILFILIILTVSWSQDITDGCDIPEDARYWPVAYTLFTFFLVLQLMELKVNFMQLRNLCW